MAALFLFASEDSQLRLFTRRQRQPYLGLLNHCWYPNQTLDMGKRLMSCLDFEAQRRRCAVDPAVADGPKLLYIIRNKDGKGDRLDVSVCPSFRL